MSDYNLTPSAVLERTKIDVSASAGTKTLHGMDNFDAFASRRNEKKGASTAMIAGGIVLAVAVIAAAVFMVLTLIG